MASGRAPFSQHYYKRRAAAPPWSGLGALARTHGSALAPGYGSASGQRQNLPGERKGCRARLSARSKPLIVISIAWAGPRVASRSLRQRSQRSRSVEYSVERQCHARSRAFAMAADAGGDHQTARRQWRRPLCGHARRAQPPRAPPEPTSSAPATAPPHADISAAATSRSVKCSTNAAAGTHRQTTTPGRRPLPARRKHPATIPSQVQTQRSDPSRSQPRHTTAHSAQAGTAAPPTPPAEQSRRQMQRPMRDSGCRATAATTTKAASGQQNDGGATRRPADAVAAASTTQSRGDRRRHSPLQRPLSPIGHQYSAGSSAGYAGRGDRRFGHSQRKTPSSTGCQDCRIARTPAPRRTTPTPAQQPTPPRRAKTAGTATNSRQGQADAVKRKRQAAQPQRQPTLRQRPSQAVRSAHAPALPIRQHAADDDA